MQLALIEIIEKIKTLHVPDDIFFICNSSVKELIGDLQEQLKISLCDFGIELQKFKIATLSKEDELLFTELTGHLIVLVKNIYMCGSIYYGSHNELYGGSISELEQGVNDGLHIHLQYPLELLKQVVLSIADESRENDLLSKVKELEILLRRYDQSLTEQARFKPFTSFQAKSIPCGVSSSASFFATKDASQQSLHRHDTQGKKGLNPHAQEFVPKLFALPKPKSEPCGVSSSASFFATKEVSQQSLHIHDTQGLNPHAQEFVSPA